MKKTLFYIIAAVALVATACDKENKTESGSVAGTWYLQVETGANEWVLTDDSKFTITEYMYKEEGNYTLSGNNLTLTATKAWNRDLVRDEMSNPVQDANGNYQYTDWAETYANTSPVTYSVKKLYQGDAMILGGAADEYSGTDDKLDIPLIRKDATKLSDIKDIQGKWYWKMFGKGGTARAVVIVDGNKGEIIITPWGERYTGTVTYEKGLIHMSNPTFSTTRYEDPNNPDVWDHINEEHPEDSPWRTPEGDYYSAYEYIVMPFIVEGDKAYATVANLYSTFEKQK